MANGRLHHTKMWESEKFAALPPLARLLQIALIDIADDQGRFKAHPAWLRSKVFPYDDVTLGDINEWLELINQNGMIILYEVDGRYFGQLVNWWEYQRHQWAQSSDFPLPPDWKDRLRITVGHKKDRKVLTYNWRDRYGKAVTDTCNQQGDMLTSEQPLQTPVTNGHNGRPFQQDKDKDQVKDQDKVTANPSPLLKTPSSRYSYMMESVGQTGNLNSTPEPFQNWVTNVAMRYSRKDFMSAVQKMASDYRSDKMNSMTIWQRVEFHLKNPAGASGIPLFTESEA